MLLKDAERPFEELTAGVTQAISTIERYQDFSKDMQMKSWPKSNDVMLNYHLLLWKQWLASDVLDPIRDAHFKDARMPKRGTFALLKAHPVLCGMNLFHVKLITQKFGLIVTNAWGAVPAILHLYNACTSRGLVNKHW